MKEKKEDNKLRIGIIGCGNMGSVILNGLLEKKTIKKKDLSVYDIDKNKTKNLKVKVEKTNQDLVKNSDIIIIAVKPKDVQNLFNEISECLTSEKVLISIMAGISIKKIQDFIKKEIPVIRVMPNLNIKVNAGIIAFCTNKLGRKYEKIVKEIFSPVGVIIKLPEEKFDTITAISGSGPGFLFYFAEILNEICREKGLSEKISKIISSYLFYGTGKMLVETKMEPEKLKNMVCSPGGTTIAGITVFEEKNFRKIFREVIDKAEKRSKELSQN